MYNIHVKIIKGVIQYIMYILKKDLEIYKERYKYNYKLLDMLIRYSLTLIKDNVKDNDYVNNVILDVKKILILIDNLVFSDTDFWNKLFKADEKHILINDSEYSKKIKEYYDALAKLFVK